MAKATVLLGSGTQVTVEGSPEEVQRLVKTLSERTSHRPSVRRKTGKGRSSNQTRASRRTGPTSHIRALRDQGFFTERRRISDVQSKLEEQGHIYNVTHLSCPLVRRTRGGELRRLKDGSGWVYVN